jgi:hypothetical protein
LGSGGIGIRLERYWVFSTGSFAIGSITLDHDPITLGASLKLPLELIFIATFTSTYFAKLNVTSKI